MIFQLFKIELKRHTRALLAPCLFSIAFGFLFSIRGSDEIYSVLNLLIRMALGIYFPIYVYRDLTKRFFYRSLLLPQLLPLRASSTFLVQIAALGCWAMLLWGSGMIEAFLNPLGLYAARIENSSTPVLGLLYLLLSKSVSVLCQLILIALGVSLSLITASYAKISRLIRIAVPLSACLLLFVSMQVYMRDFSNWMIGSTSTAAYPQYAGFLAITFENFGAVSDISDTILWTSVALNSLIAIAALIVILPLINSPVFESKGEQHYA